MPTYLEAMRIALVSTYFGSLPNYFQYWLESAGKNESIAFLIFSDCDFSSYTIPDNVFVHFCSFEEVRLKAESVLGFRTALYKPYKLCDFKPLYGLIFETELKGYEYWGHCDLDIIWGDLRKFLALGLEGGYDRLLSNGHLCLYRNESRINRFLFSPPADEHVTYRDIYRLSGGMAYDESELLADNLTAVGGRQWDSGCFADVDFRTRQFVCTYKGKKHETVSFFQWKNGSLFGYWPSEKGLCSKEYAYLHLQKRKMTTDGNPLNRCVITPTGFVSEEFFDGSLATSLCTPDPSWESYWKRKELLIKIQNNMRGYAFLKIKRKLLNRSAK